MKCHNCGNEFEGKFCPECGTPVADETNKNNIESDTTLKRTTPKNRTALLGFRSNKIWKKILSIAYLFFCGLLLILNSFEARQGQITIYDFVIDKVFSIFMVLVFISPYIFLSNSKLRDSLPFFKEHKAGKSALGLTIVIVILFALTGIVNGLHSAEYKADMENHAYIVVSSTDADCTTAGEVEYYCEYCGKTEIKKDEALGHDLQEASRIEATCTAKGNVTSKCSRCDFEQFEEIAALGHNIQESSRIEPTCTEQGSVVGKCSRCNENASEMLAALGHDMKEISRTEPSGDNDGTITYKCSRCTHQTTEPITNPNPKGSKANPYVLDADEWHKAHSGGTSKKYINQYVKVTGLVLNISDYNSLKGYYLVGGPGCGLVCWVENGTTNIQYGQEVQYLGKVTVEESGHIEIAECEVVSANWPTELRKSPITVSDWSWSRDYVGGVEWNFRLTNNTDKVVKYISLKWNCYNAVGDLVYDEITWESSHGVKYTGPLNPGETTDYLCNSTRFYSHSFSTSRFTLIQVEFMDGTIIRINDKAYTDYYVSKLEAEVVTGSNGIKYIVNNNLNTCYIADIGTCTDSYIGILTSLYGDTVTAIGDYAFENATFIEKISITYALERIGVGAFKNCSSLTYIDYYGSIEEWNSIEKGEGWDNGTGEYVIHCEDGQILKDGTIIYE